MKRLPALAGILALLAVAIGPAQAEDESRIGANLTVPEGRTVDNAISIGGRVKVSGEVLRDAVAVGGDVEILSTGRVRRNVVAIGGRIITEAGADIGGQRVEIQNVPGLSLLGKLGTLTLKIPEIQSTLTSVLHFLRGIYWINTVLTLLALSLLSVFFLGDHVEGVFATIQGRPWRSAGVGAGGLICLVPLIAMSGISVFAIPLIPVLVMAAAAGVLTGYTAVGLLVGRLIPYDPVQETPYLAVGAGVVLIAVASATPVIGWLVSAAAVILGFGAVLLSRFGTRPSS